MSRAQGRKGTPRKPAVTPAEAANIGLSDLQNPEGSPIPGLTGNILNHETHRQRPATGDGGLAEFRGMMAHGIEPTTETQHDRASHMRGGRNAPRKLREDKPPAVVVPVPVYLVEHGDPDGKTLLSAAPRNITVPPSAGGGAGIGDAYVRVCGRNPRRARIGLLNEDTATNIRFATRPSDLVNGGGALLPYPVNSYSWFRTQDELFATTTSTTLSVKMSIIEEYDGGT
jgi:hypothetical protein